MMFGYSISLPEDPNVYPLYVEEHNAFYYHEGYDEDGDACINPRIHGPWHASEALPVICGLMTADEYEAIAS